MIEELVLQGRELCQFVLDFTWYMRNLLLLETTDGDEEVLDMTTRGYAAPERRNVSDRQ